MAGWLGGWVAGWLRKAENKAKAQHSWGLGLAELGNKQNVAMYVDHMAGIYQEVHPY